MKKCTIILLLSVGTGPSQGQTPTREVFERTAREMTILGPGQFLRGLRPDALPSPGDVGAMRAFVDVVERGHHMVEDFRGLLRHEDPKVRTLAIVALYTLDDPGVLPDVFRLVTDDAETFRALVPTAALALSHSEPSTEKQTVGAIATSILDVYLESGGYHHGPLATREPGFDAYWKAHAGRSSSAGWWAIRLGRASGGTSPTPPGRFDAIRALRGRIDAVAEPDRTFVLLWLQGDEGSDVLVSTSELINRGQRLGPDTLVEILERRIPTEDPDLQPRLSNNHRYARMCLFILRHAGALLRPSDAAGLLERELWERNYAARQISDPLVTPWWAIAAATLNRRESASIIRQAHERFRGQYDGEHRLELALALRQLTGDQHTPVVVDWFYREVATPPVTTFAVSSALAKLLGVDSKNRNVFLRALVDDQRFDSLNWRSLEALARAVNARLGRSVISEQEIASVSGPGIDLFVQDIPRLRANHPEQTSSIVATLARWRRILRDSVRQLEEG